jgi:rhamnosyltransferase
MRISIALASYNGERFLTEQLDSLARQTQLPHELVVCDDGSRDRTLEIVKNFADRARFQVQCVENERNLGWKDNFLKAAKLCTGDWIAFCDQDDVWMPKKLELLSKVAEQHSDLQLIVHAAAVAYENLEFTGERLPNVRRFRVLRPLRNRPWNMPAGFASCFRSSLLDGVPVEKRPHDPNWPQDRLSHCKLVYLLANSWGDVAYLPEVLAIYRRHPKAVTARGSKGRPERNWANILEGRLRTGAAEYSRLATCASEFAQFMRELAQQPLRADRSVRAAAYYDSLAKSLTSRASLYSEPEMAHRARSLLSLLSSGAYSRLDGERLGIGAITKDVAAVASSPIVALLRRLQSVPSAADAEGRDDVDAS